jgi:hypothetical protein
MLCGHNAKVFILKTGGACSSHCALTKQDTVVSVCPT